MGNSKYTKVWNLDNLFGEGIQPQLEDEIMRLEEMLTSFKSIGKLESKTILLAIKKITSIQIQLSQMNSYTTCLFAQNVKDRDAVTLKGLTATLNSRADTLTQRFQGMISQIDSETWEKVLASRELENYKYILTEWRKKDATFLSEKEEIIVSDLMVDGYHAWGQLYQSLIGSIKVKIEIDDELRELSVGQSINLRSHPNEKIRKRAHDALEEIWRKNEDIFAQILNHIASFRLQVYNKRGFDNILTESLMENRLKEETLTAMWAAVNKYKQPFIDYLTEKAKMNGHEKMLSYNFWAPIGQGDRKITYDHAVDLIIESFGNFGDGLETFARHAFENNWVEAEDRKNKSTVAFCASFPMSGESRVFMTYGDRITNVLTLAHELGHAFHNFAMKSVDAVNRKYPLTMAETASTFTEQIILDASLEKAESPEEKLFLLDEKLKRSVMNFMNMYSRFLFEMNFYEERKRGYVPPERLNEIMEESFSVAYGGSLEHPSLYSWIWTPHYYITKSPFYHFQYTFGYLLSLSLYARSKEKGKEFEKDYSELLRDSGCMSTEDLVMKHLGEDITTEGFWEKGLKLCVQDVEEFKKIIHNPFSI